MNGIFSAHPSPAVARLLLGSMLLFLVQAGFVLKSADVQGGLRAIVVLIAGVGVGALVLAICGMPTTQADQWRHRHGS